MNKNLEQEIYEYWQRQPCGIWHSNESPESKEFFLEISEFRQRVFDNTDEAFFSSFVNFEGRQNERVLEIGCGIGTDGARFAENGAVYTGIDVSSRAIEIAQTRFKLFDLPGALMVLDGTSDLYPLGRFDLVYSYGITGTPTLFFTDGSRFPGAVQITDIEKKFSSLK